MKLYVEGLAAGTGVPVIGWLEIIAGQAFVCEKDSVLGVKKYAITEITKFLGVREAESVFFGENLG